MLFLKFFGVEHEDRDWSRMYLYGRFSEPEGRDGPGVGGLTGQPQSAQLRYVQRNG
jgi:hypothetical protein